MSKKYNLATANRRIWCRVCDFLFIYIFICTIDVLILYFDTEHFKTIPKNQYTYMILTSVSFILNTIYFIIVPCFSNKNTLFSIAFKINVYFSNKKKLSCIIKKELFIWIFGHILLFLISILLLFLNKENTKIFFDCFSNLMNIKNFSIATLFAIIFNVLFTFYLLFLLLALINTIFRSHKLTLLDKFSKTAIYYTKSIDIEDKQANNKNKYAPGLITKEELENI